MKNRILGLLVLTGLLSTCTVFSAYAQRGHGGGGGHFGGGGGGHFGGGGFHSSSRVMSAPASHYSSPRINPGSSGRIVRGGPAFGGSGHIGGGSRTVIVHGGGWVHGGYPGYYRYHHGWRPYYGYYYPPLGFYVSALPFGYFTLGAAFGPMYYYGGSYYAPVDDSNQDEGYKVVDAPVGALVPDLPDGATEVQVNGQPYYDVNGTYYQEVMTDNGRRYKVVGKNLDANQAAAPANNNSGNNPAPAANSNFVTELPAGARSVTINGQEYYLTPDGMYYQATTNNGVAGFTIVGKMNAGQ